MSALIKGMVTVAAVLVAAGTGLWAGQTGMIKLPIGRRQWSTWRSRKPPGRSSTTAIPAVSRLYALTPKRLMVGSRMLLSTPVKM